MSKMIIVEGNSNDKDNVRAIMVKGEKGYSAYEIAVQNGYEGTEEEWKDSFLNADNYYNKNEVDAKNDIQDAEILEEATTRANTDNNLQAQINSLASGNPLVASSISDMTDTSKIYVNTTDGYWYYYDGSSWQQGDIYQSRAIGNGSVTYDKLGNDLKDNFIPQFYETGDITTDVYLRNSNTYSTNAGTGYRILTADVTGLSKIFVSTYNQSASIYMVSFFDVDDNRVGYYGYGQGEIVEQEIEVPSNAIKVVVNGFRDHDIIVKYISDCKLNIPTPDLANVDDNIINILSNKQLGVLEKGYICLTFDDGEASAVTNTFPILQSKNVPATFALWSTSQIITNSTYLSSLRDMITNYGCNVCQHGQGSFTDLTKSELIEYLTNEKKAWNNLNIDVNGLCYPNHNHNKETMAICGSMFNVCCTGGADSSPLQGTEITYGYGTNGARTNSYELYRRSLYSATLENLIAAVNYAYDNNKVLILFAHDGDIVNEQATKLADIIDYAKNKGIEFTTINNLDKIK